VTQRIHHRQLDYHLQSGAYYHHTIVSLMYMLAATGWDCKSGFFKQSLQDEWLHAAVYKSQHKLPDPKTVSWYQLAELELLPETAELCINQYGYLKQQDLVLPWLDHSLTSMFLR